MPEDDLFQVFVRRLAALDLRYMVTGSVAAMLDGAVGKGQRCASDGVTLTA
jgi:hypothetical protein